MSVADFSSAIKEAAYKSWFKNSQKNILVQTASDLRDDAQKAQRTSFFLSTESLLQIAQKLAGRELSEDQTETLFGDLLSLVDNKKALLIQEELKGGSKTVTGVYFRQVNFDGGINNILSRALSSVKDRVVIEDKGKTREARVSDFFQKGHVFGIASNISTQTARNLARSNITQETKDKLLNILVGVRNRLIKDDVRSSNIKDLNFSLYAKYFKTPYKYLVEMQIKEVNQAAGTDTALFTNALRRYFSPENSASGLAKELNTRNSTGDNLIRKLINSRGSPSFVDLIGIHITNTLSGKKTQTEYATSSVKAATITRKLDTSKQRAAIAKNINAVNAAISKVRLLEPSSAPKGVSSTANLIALMQTRLALQIRKNMGTGSARNVLNYRTGRFAESAQIEQISTSREGMLSVFYSYMKHPYATFSAGGAQSTPQTRDPKLLISKSIREIGASLVANRMRAVLK